LCHRIRAAMKDEGFATLPGVLEVDEAYVEFAHHQPTAL